MMTLPEKCCFLLMGAENDRYIVSIFQVTRLDERDHEGKTTAIVNQMAEVMNEHEV